MNPRLGGAIDPNREIGFGSVAVRCVAMRTNERNEKKEKKKGKETKKMRWEAVYVRAKRRDSPSWCFQWALAEPCRGAPWPHPTLLVVWRFTELNDFLLS